MTEVVINATNLSKQYKEQLVFEQLDFSVKKGEIIALLGKNGAGKSTLINLLTQLVPKNQGDIHYFKQKVNTPIDRERISVMTQETVRLQKLRVSEVIELARSFSRHPLAYNELLNYADLVEQEQFYMEKLSGGQRRRLGFALALASDPEVLFLDEPTAGMDSHSRQKFWRTITELKAQGKTFIVTSHYLEELETIADRIVILVKGKFVFDGTMTELRKNRGTSEIQFYSKQPIDYWQTLAGVESVKRTNQKIQIVSHDVARFLEAMQGNYEKLDQLEIKPNSLESIFDRVQEENQ